MCIVRKLERRNIFRVAIGSVISATLLVAGLFIAIRMPTTQPHLLYLKDRLRLGLRHAGPEHPLEAVLNDPSGLFIDRAGIIYFSERRNHVIRKLEGDRVTRLAGTGRSGFTGDGCCAAFVRLRFPEGLAVDDAGNLFVADSGNHRVRRISPNGTIETVAGIGRPGYAGDGGPATKAAIATPNDVALGPAGEIFIADYGNHSVRRIAHDGTIETVAGNGESGFSGDGGPARLASLDGPYGIFVDSEGILYIADSGNNRVRRVLRDGTIATIAGTGEAGFGGDGGPAMAALLDSPQAVFVTLAGEIFINDEHNHRVRKVLLAGTIVTVAGNGEPDLCGDGGPASEACLNDPERIYLDGAGNLFLTDGDNHRLRRVSPDGIITTIAGSDPSGRRAR